MSRSSLLLSITVAALAVLGSPPVRADQDANAYRIKAAFVLNFLKLTSFSDASLSSIKICVVDQDAFTDFDVTLNGKAVGATPIIVSKVATTSAEGCSVLYSPTSASFDVARGVLTITDKDLCAGNAQIGFYFDEGKIRFAINQARARAAGIEISSKLLALAQLRKCED